MAESTHMEALTAELLGDVGKLHDQIKTLRDEDMPGLVEDIKGVVEAPRADLSAAAQAVRSTAELIKTSARDTLLAYGQAADKAKGELNAAAKLAAANAQESIDMAVGKLVPTVADAVAKATAAKVREIDLAYNAFMIWSGCLMLGAFFALGMVYGAGVLASLQNDKFTIGRFLTQTGWGISAGLAAPALIGIGLWVRRLGEELFGWAVIMLGVLPTIVMFLKLLGIV